MKVPRSEVSVNIRQVLIRDWKLQIFSNSQDPEDLKNYVQIFRRFKNKLSGCNDTLSKTFTPNNNFIIQLFNRYKGVQS